MSAPDSAPDLAALSFEEAMKALETIVKQLERGDISLEESIEAYSRGTALKQHCEAKLKAAQMKVEHITGGGEAVGLAPFGDDRA